MSASPSAAMVPNAAPTAEQIRALARRLVTPERVIIGVRHHSPSSARAVRQAIEKYRPARVLVEGPRSFTPLVESLADERARTPLAIYAYTEAKRGAKGAPGLGAYYPFCDFSPELVAVRDAAAAGIPSSFIDLDIAEQHATSKADDASSLQWDERRLVFSETLRAVAEQLGCRDADELWEQYFESAALTEDPAEHAARLVAYCALARADTSPREHDRDGTTAREAEMTWHVTEAMAAADGPVLVVVGGYHAVVLPDLLDDPPPRPLIKAPASRAALIRFSEPRVDSVNGYAAGIRSPGWHRRSWEHMTAGRGDYRTRAATESLLAIAGRLRELGYPVALPTVTDADAHVRRLARLRGRSAPTTRDLRDAVAATFVKGDVAVEGQVPLEVTEEILTGDLIGQVPPGTATPPLVADALARVEAARLTVDDPVSRETTLQIYRRPAARQTSRILHGLVLLDVPFGELVRGPDFTGGTDLHLITERWRYRWSPATEAGLVEASRYGSTLPAAVATRFAEVVDDFLGGADRSSAEAAAALIARSCVVGSRERDDALAAAAAEAVADEPSFCGAATACNLLTMLFRAREPLAAADFPALPDLARSALRRADYLARLLPAEDPDQMITAVLALREAVGETALLDADEDRAALAGIVRRLADDHGAPAVRGAAVGLRYSDGELSAAETAGRLRGALSGTLGPADALPFLTGLMRTAREFAWQETDLVDVLGDLLGSWTDDQFGEALPLLRLALSELTPGETDLVAAVVGRRLGIDRASSELDQCGDPRWSSGSEPIGEEPYRDPDHQQLNAQASELLVAQGLSEWLGEP
ncbi:hypothetical protein HUN08_16885 [Gordonia sp. X0973]|uniref:DUF5682 family protein n=1 Tax=Gordonia sp. X0973 TaxID=2742602 RepID=UPI00101C7362|nr:DUF5682 family protein [Gordonia sp. X0973]QKT08695.1 hypothetical protein HUN08_16885 [Gordonia sp. X0973]